MRRNQSQTPFAGQPLDCFSREADDRKHGTQSTLARRPTRVPVRQGCQPLENGRYFLQKKFQMRAHEAVERPQKRRVELSRFRIKILDGVV